MILGPVEQLLATERPMASWRTQLDRVQRNALLLLNRVSEILDFAKAEAGKFELCWEAVDLSKVIGTLAGDAAVVAELNRLQKAAESADPAERESYIGFRLVFDPAGR